MLMSMFSDAEVGGGSVTFSLPTSSDALALRIDLGDCRANWGVEVDGDIFRRIHASVNGDGTYTDLGDWIDPKGDANGSNFQFRCGDLGLGFKPDQPTAVGSAVTIPTGAIASQTWHDLDTTCEWYHGVSSASKAGSFYFQIKHVPSGGLSAICTVTIIADGLGI